MAGTEMLDFSGFIADRTNDFTGREWVLRAIDDWLGIGNGPRLFWLTGGPGMGKSTVIARLAQMSHGDVPATDYSHLGLGSLVYAHFCQVNTSTINPLRFVEALARELANHHPAFRDALLNIGDQNISVQPTQTVGTAESGAQVIGVSIQSLHIGGISPRTAFDRIVRGPLEALNQSGFASTILVAVDALDEALTFDDPDNHLVALLATVRSDPPPHLRLLVTSRPDDRITVVLGQPSLDLVGDKPPKVDDVLAYAVNRLRADSVPEYVPLAQHVADASDGNFLYARYVLDELTSQAELPGDVKTLVLPKGLDGVYRQFVERELARNREAWKDRYRPLLGLLAVARSPGLTRQHLEDVSGLSGSQVDDALESSAQYLLGARSDGPISIYHQSFREFLLTDTMYQVYPAEAHRRLADFFLDIYGKDWIGCHDSYALRHVPFHLAQAAKSLDRPTARRERSEQVQALTNLLTDLRFIEPRVAEMTIYAVLADMQETAGILPETASSEHQISSTVSALDLEAHNLRRWRPAQQPTLLAQQLYNRTRNDRNLLAFTAQCVDRLKEIGKPYFDKMWSARRESAVLVRTLDEHDGPVNALIMTSDERILVSGGDDGMVAVWDIATGLPLLRLEYVPVSYSNWQLRRRDVSSRGTQRMRSDTAINALAVLPDNRRVLAGLQNGHIETLDLQTGESVEPTLEDLGSPIFALARSPDGRYLMAIIGRKRQLVLYNVSKKQVERLWLETDGYFTAAAMVSRLALLAIVDRETSHVETVDLDTFGTMLQMNGHRGVITGIAVTPDGSIAATADTDGLLKVWNLHQGQEVSTVCDWATIEDQDRRYGPPNLVDAWERYLEDRNILPPVRRISWGDGPLRWHSVALSPDGRLAFTGLPDGRLHQWDLTNQQLIAEIDAHRGAVRALIISPTGRYAVSGAEDGKIKVWDLGASVEHEISAGHRDWVNALIFTPDGSQLVSGSDDGTIRLWDAKNGKELRRIVAHEGWVLDFAFVANDRTLFSAGGDGTIKSWELNGLAPIRTFKEHEGRVHGVKVTAEGELVSAAADHTVKVWNPDTGEVIHTLLGHEGKVIRIAPVPGRRQVVSASEDKTLRILESRKRSGIILPARPRSPGR